MSAEETRRGASSSPHPSLSNKHSSGGSVAGRNDSESGPADGEPETLQQVPRTEQRHGPTTLLKTDRTEAEEPHELLRLEQIMRQPDSIVEPNILQVVREYIAKGGKPQTVLELLSDNYVGFAPMASLAASWLDLVSRDPRAAAANGGPLPPAITARDPAARVEPAFLRDLITGRFDPERIGVSEWMPPAVTDDAPLWAVTLLRSPSSRELVYRLAEQHPGTLLLEYLVLLCVRAGHHVQEHDALARRLTTFYAHVFCVLLDAVDCSVEGQPAVLRALVRLSDSAAKYLIVQQVLEELSYDTLTGRVLSGRLRRLSQDLEHQVGVVRGSMANELSFTLGHSSLPSKRPRGGVQPASQHRSSESLMSERLEGAVLALVTTADLPTRRAALLELHHAFQPLVPPRPAAAGPEGSPSGNRAPGDAGPGPNSQQQQQQQQRNRERERERDPFQTTRAHATPAVATSPFQPPLLLRSPSLANSIPTELKTIVASSLVPRRSSQQPLGGLLPERGPTPLGMKRGRADETLDVEETSLRPQSRGPAAGLTPLLSPIRPALHAGFLHPLPPNKSGIPSEFTAESMQLPPHGPPPPAAPTALLAAPAPPQHPPAPAPSPAPEEPVALPPPSLDLLRHPRVLEALTRAVFYHPSPSLRGAASEFSRHEQAVAADLLALASAGVQEDEAQGFRETVAVARSRIHDALSLLRACSGAKADPSVVADLFASPMGVRGLEAIQQSAASAAGALQYLRGWLLDQEAYRRPTAGALTCCMLQVLHEVLRHHAALRCGIVQLCESALRAQGSRVPLLSRRFIDVLVSCALLGHVDGVLASLEALVSDHVLDEGIARYFVLQLLSQSAPPYSMFFASAVARIALSLACLGGGRAWELGAVERGLLEQLLDRRGVVGETNSKSESDPAIVRLGEVLGAGPRALRRRLLAAAGAPARNSSMQALATYGDPDDDLEDDVESGDGEIGLGLAIGLEDQSEIDRSRTIT